MIYRKYDQSLHWHMTMRYLGQDEHGIWAGMRSGARMAKGSDEPVVLPCASVSLFPHTGWWTASFNALPHEVGVYCDITTPPTWPGEDVVTMVDLDLDVIRHYADDLVSIVDEDEFLEHQVHFGYPPEVIERAASAAEWLRNALATRAEPFWSRYQPWLSIVDG